MDGVSFVIPGLPLAWARARLHGHRHFTPKKQEKKMAVVEAIAATAMNGRPVLEGPVRLRVSAIWPWPKSMSAKKRSVAGAHYRSSRPDADNVAKLIGDSLNGICFVDDAQVVELSVSKQFGLSGATYVAVEPLTVEGHDETADL